MKIPHPKVIHLMILFAIILSVFSCAKDSDLLSEALLNGSNISSVEERKAAEAEEPVVANGNSDWVTKSFAFPPISDAYVQEEEGYDQSIVRLQEGYRTSYLKFDLSLIEGNIVSAVLHFTIDSDDGDGTIMVSKGGSNNWAEEDLTESNAPSLDISLGSINKEYLVGVTEKITLNTTDLLPEVTTIVLSHTSGNDLAFASKEHPDNIGPKLVVTYQVPPGTSDIEPVAEENNENESSSETPPTEETPPSQEDNGEQESMNQYPPPDYYVTVNGKASNNGRTEASAWSIQHALSNAVAGDVVYIKAGNYGSDQLVADNSGNQGNPIKFIGYTNTPGDLVSNEGSTYSYGDSLDPNKMPYINGNSPTSGIGLKVEEDFIEIENIQITKFRNAVRSLGKNVVLRNIIATELGDQNSFESYEGFGIEIRGDYSLVENCFVYNASAEAIKLYDSDYSRVNYCSVWADNQKSPTDYYFLLAGGTNNSIIENSYAERAPGLTHGGHGFDMKDLAEHNTFKNCRAKGTSFELNFSGVKYNTIEDCTLIGTGTESGQWETRLVIFNGANNNLIKNMNIQNTWTAISWADYDDGYVGEGGDRDEVSCGYNNTFENITVQNTTNVLNIGGGTNYSAKASNNTFVNCTFKDFNKVATVYYTTENIRFENCDFDNGQNLYSEAGNQYAPYSNFDVTWVNCTWTNVNFTPPD